MCLAKCFQREPPKRRKFTYSVWSVEMHSWFDKMRSLFRVVNPGSCGVTKLSQAARSFCAGSYGPAPVLLPRPKGGAGRPRRFDKDFQPGHRGFPGGFIRKIKKTSTKSISCGGESGIRTHSTVRLIDEPVTSKADMTDRTSFAPETTSPERNEGDQSPTKIKQNQRSRPLSSRS